MASTPQSPIHIHIPASLQQYTVSLTRHLAAHPQYTNLVVSSFIFDGPSIPVNGTDTSASAATSPQSRLLLLQRAAHEVSFANLWEVPGGSSDSNDPTILHSAAREVFEETGLMLTRFVRQIGEVVEFKTGKGARKKNWAKLNFEIEVAEIGGRGHEEAHKHLEAFQAIRDRQDGHHKLEGGKGAQEKEVTITIDLEEHQSYAWVTEEQIRDGTAYPIATPAQRDLMIRAFTERRKEAEALTALKPEGTT